MIWPDFTEEERKLADRLWGLSVIYRYAKESRLVPREQRLRVATRAYVKRRRMVLSNPSIEHVLAARITAAMCGIAP